MMSANSFHPSHLEQLRQFASIEMYMTSPSSSLSESEESLLEIGPPPSAGQAEAASTCVQTTHPRCAYKPLQEALLMLLWR